MLPRPLAAPRPESPHPHPSPTPAASPQLEPRVLRIPIVPGADPTLTYGDVYGRGVRGVVLETFGVGNLPDRASFGWWVMGLDGTQRGGGGGARAWGLQQPHRWWHTGRGRGRGSTAVRGMKCSTLHAVRHAQSCVAPPPLGR